MTLPAIVAGIPIEDVTMETAVERIGRFVDEGRRHGRIHHIATVNVDFVDGEEVVVYGLHFGLMF